MFINALMIYLLFISSIKAPGNCSGFPCCNKPVSNPEFDPKGKAYGFENGESCIVPDGEKVSDEKLLDPTPVFASSKVEEAVAVNATDANHITPSSTDNGVASPIYLPVPIIETASAIMPVQSPNPAQPAAVVIPQTFPELPDPTVDAASLKNACEEANAVLIYDINQCFAPLVNKVYDHVDAVDKISVQAVDCICATSHWRVGSKEIEVSLKSTCTAPGNLKKYQAQEINDGCSIFPYNYIAVINAVGLKTRLSNGYSYLPLSQFSGSEDLKPSLVLFGLICLIVSEHLFDSLFINY